MVLMAGRATLSRIVYREIYLTCGKVAFCFNSCATGSKNMTRWKQTIRSMTGVYDHLSGKADGMNTPQEVLDNSGSQPGKMSNSICCHTLCLLSHWFDGIIGNNICYQITNYRKPIQYI